MKKLFENWNKYLNGSVNESIGVEDDEALRGILTTVYNGMITSHSPEQKQRTTDDKGNVSYRKVDPDPHVEARRSILNLVGHMIDKIQQGPSEPQGEEDVG